MGSSDVNISFGGDKEQSENKKESETFVGKESKESQVDGSENKVLVIVEPNKPEKDTSTSKETDAPAAAGPSASKKGKRKFKHGKKNHLPPKDAPERNSVRRVHHAGAKFKQGRKRALTFPSISKFFLPHNRPRKETFIPPTKFLLGGNISDPLNLNSLQDEDINRAMNAVTPQSSPLPTPPQHKAKIDVIIPPNIRDPLNLLEPLDNEEYEKRLEMQQRKRKRAKVRRRTTETAEATDGEKMEIKNEPLPESSSKARKRSCSESEQKGKDAKRLRRLDSLDKIVSPVVPQPGAWMRARIPSRSMPSERPVSPHRPKPEGEQKLPTFHTKNTRYQYGNYDRYYGYRNLNAMMDVRLQVFEMHRHLFQNKDVLDIGCNVGHVSIAVARSYGARSVVGIDIDSSLIDRARKTLKSYVPLPNEPKAEEEKKHENCEESNVTAINCVTEESKPEPSKDKDTGKKGEIGKDTGKDNDIGKDGTGKVNVTGKTENDTGKDDDTKKIAKKIRKPKKNRKANGKQEIQGFFPNSFAMIYGPITAPGSDIACTTPLTFPKNVTFKQANYVPLEESSTSSTSDSPQYDLILCLSTTKWLHLNWGDAGLKRAFRKMFADLRPGGKLVLEAQNWASYKKKKRLTATIYENFNSIEFFPNKFRDYLLSPEVGFSKCCILGVPQHTSKGFRRPIELYIKGDFTPSKARWSDAHAPSSHHKPDVEPPVRTVYAPVGPAYRPSDDAPSCGAATPFSPNLDQDDSPFYNPRSDSYAPSYAPPRPTVYATLPSPLNCTASPARSPEPLAAKIVPLEE